MSNDQKINRHCDLCKQLCNALKTDKKESYILLVWKPQKETSTIKIPQKHFLMFFLCVGIRGTFLLFLFSDNMLTEEKKNKKKQFIVKKMICGF